MLCFQPRIFSPTEELTADRFSQLIISDDVNTRISRIRQLREEGNTKEADALKRGLPSICFQATFDETQSAKGNLGRWRKQSACRLNGLFITDYDHMKVDPRKTVERWVTDYAQLNGLEDKEPQEQRRAFCMNLGIVLIHVTSSGRGLRVVAVANAATGNLADNQRWLSEKLGMTCDEAIKDATRLSFCPGFNDIIYINKEKLFNYDNPEYDQEFGPLYRGNNSQPTRKPAAGSGHAADVSTQPAHGSAGKADGKAVEAGEEDQQLLERVKQGYHGVSYSKIIAAWFDEVTHGEPAVGDRHRTLLKLCADLRYICDNNPRVVTLAVTEHPVGSRYAGEDAADLERIAGDACQKQMWQNIPKRLRPVLEAAGVQLDGGGADEGAEAAPAIDYGAFGQRLEPLLGDARELRDAVADLQPHLKLGGLLAAGAMMGTYLTRCWWQHFDGRDYRLSFLVYIVGTAASGKSFLTRLDELLMEPLLSADRIGREVERQFKERQRRRKANEQLPDVPHPVIRYCPSSTSNAIFYRRLQDAIDPEATGPDGQPMHLHIYTCESELATALRAQIGSWAGKNDLELKSFHNETAGVDFANADSTNGIMQVNWNQVISGTKESMSRKIKPATVLDGLVTRLVLFPMPDNDFEMLPFNKGKRDHEREVRLRQLGIKLEQVKGELRCPKLVQFCWDYENELTRQARMERDECLDYFRKRIPVIMMRYTLVRMVLRQYDRAVKGEELVPDKSDLEFARLIGDWCLQAQINMFGQMVQDARELERQAFKPRKMQTATREKFNKLPDVLTSDLLLKEGIAKNQNSAYMLIKRWLEDGLLTKTARGEYKKKIKTLQL